MSRIPILALCAAAVGAGCGGGDHGGGSAPIAVSGAEPPLHDGALRIEGSAMLANERRLPDPFSAEPYCLVRVSGAAHAAGDRYDLVLAFAVADGRVLALTLTRQRRGDEAVPWGVAAFNPPAAEARVDLPRRVLRMNSLRSTQGWQLGWRATLDGALAFPANPTHAGCGA